MQIATVKEDSKLTLTVSGRIDTVTAPELEKFPVFRWKCTVWRKRWDILYFVKSVRKSSIKPFQGFGKTRLYQTGRSSEAHISSQTIEGRKKKRKHFRRRTFPVSWNL